MATTPKHRHIYIISAQCTGKTTLVNALEQHFQRTSEPNRQPGIIREVARTVLVEHNFNTAEIASSPSRSLALQKLILEAQVRAERAALEQYNWFVSDRSGVDPIVYALRHVGRDAADTLMQSPQWVELKGRMETSHVVLCEAGANWLKDDGVRLMPLDGKDWMKFHSLFCELLDGLGVEYVILPREATDLSRRVEFVLSSWGSRGLDRRAG